ncbi:hypothetical protein [Mangrovibacter sp. MFB070]|uniref:hypothetical protein n=1 Tax=Mangrovibacter sp. MFB070 TaxID=1224318 RepID=UPI0013646FA8|nr:hypothetical protein [Mangrovibacter sp. MFB070]
MAASTATRCLPGNLAEIQSILYRFNIGAVNYRYMMPWRVPVEQNNGGFCFAWR